MLKIFALRGGIMMTMKTQADSYTHQFQNIFRIAYRRYVSKPLGQNNPYCKENGYHVPYHIFIIDL